MKKSIHISALVASLTAVSAWGGGPEFVVPPDYFSGFFVGGTGAFHMAGFDGSSSAVASEDVSSSLVYGPFTLTQTYFSAGSLANNTIDGNAFNGYYGVQGGVGKVFDHRWYMGFVGFGEWGSQSSTDVSDESVPSTLSVSIADAPWINFPAVVAYHSTSTIKLSNNYGVALKPGFLVAPKTMVYGKIGAAWASLKVSNTFNGVSHGSDFSFPVTGADADADVTYTSTAQVTGSSSAEATKVALLLGIGAEQFIYRNFITVNVEYTYVNYGSVSTSAPLHAMATATVSGAGSGVLPVDNFDGDIGVVQSTASAKVSTLLGGLNFYFGSQWF